MKDNLKKSIVNWHLSNIFTMSNETKQDLLDNKFNAIFLSNISDYVSSLQRYYEYIVNNIALCLHRNG